MPDDTGSSREEHLAKLYAECCERLNAGEIVDIERVVPPHVRRRRGA